MVPGCRENAESERIRGGLQGGAGLGLARDPSNACPCSTLFVRHLAGWRDVTCRNTRCPERSLLLYYTANKNNQICPCLAFSLHLPLTRSIPFVQQSQHDPRNEQLASPTCRHPAGTQHQYRPHTKSLTSTQGPTTTQCPHTPMTAAPFTSMPLSRTAIKSQ